MAIPDFQSIMLPMLFLAKDEKIHYFHDAVEQLALEFDLSEKELSILIPSGQPKFMNRAGWAKTHIRKAGLIDYPQRGHFQITQRGLDVLKENPEKIDMSYLMRFKEFADFRKKSQSDTDEVDTIDDHEKLTPLESIEVAYQKIRTDLADDLLEFVVKSSPGFFEKLVVELLVAMGYGGTQREATRAVGGSGDEGIDGIIDEDRLGLDIIYIQAKRWQRSSKIGRPQIQEFVGALHGKRASKGVFITTADFSDSAREYVKGITSKVVLIDGQRLANLMIDYGIGVTTRINYEIKELDTDYFGEVINDQDEK